MFVSVMYENTKMIIINEINNKIILLIRYLTKLMNVLINFEKILEIIFEAILKSLVY